MANNILVVLEQREGIIKRSGFQAAFTAANLAKDLNGSAEAVVVGDVIKNLNEVSKYGIQKVIHLKNSELANYSSSGYTEAITNLAKEADYDILILSNTALGKD
ncbi:MAG: electron transfer flavoprotein subunit alpha/FixB family protein, partial [Ignavibacteriaceae bacterium]|nr:electron transfer flavoprotein subunit alpha/FixB family protein [Ignavibacteriaceae bacterium]